MFAIEPLQSVHFSDLAFNRMCKELDKFIADLRSVFSGGVLGGFIRPG